MEDQKFEVTQFDSDTEKEYKEGDVVITACGTANCPCGYIYGNGTGLAFQLPS